MLVVAGLGASADFLLFELAVIAAETLLSRLCCILLCGFVVCVLIEFVMLLISGRFSFCAVDGRDEKRACEQASRIALWVNARFLFLIGVLIVDFGTGDFLLLSITRFLHSRATW